MLHLLHLQPMLENTFYLNPQIWIINPNLITRQFVGYDKSLIHYTYRYSPCYYAIITDTIYIYISVCIQLYFT